MSYLKNIVTFGAHGRIERKVEEFEGLKQDYESLYLRMETRRKEIDKTLENVIHVKVNAVKSLGKINKISKNLKTKDREFIYRNTRNEYETVNFKQIDQTISAGQIAMSATKGISVGVGTALGAWALASTFGTASTGAAIVGLSGAAATNATLAWFGGGAVAAGGGGIAAGTAVIGGIIAIPAIALLGVFNHLNANKKINEIELEMKKIIEYLDQMQSNLLKMDLIDKRSEELIISIATAKKVFEIELEKTLRKLNRFVLLSRMIRWIRKNIFNRNYYSESDLKKIAYIGGIASDFAIIIDTPIFED